MYFVDAEHKKFFEEHRNEGYGKDVLSAIYLLGSLDKTRNANAIDYNSLMFNDVDDSLWSNAEYLVLCIARHLFTGNDEGADITECAIRLDSGRKQALLQAVSIRFFGAVD